MPDEKPVVAEPQAPVTPITPDPAPAAPAPEAEPQKKMSAEEFAKQMPELVRSGKVPKYANPADLIKQFVNFDEVKSEGTPPAAPTDAPAAAPESKPEAAPEKRYYKSVGEMLKAFKDETGESYETADDYIKAAKRHKDEVETYKTAGKEWRADLARERAQKEELAKSIEATKQELERQKREIERMRNQAKPAPTPEKKDEIEDEPEPRKPADDAPFEQWKDYQEDIRKRDLRVSVKKEKKLREEFDSQMRNIRIESDRKTREVEERARLEVQNTLSRDTQQRYADTVITTAEDFQTRHAEFKFADSKTLRQKDAEWKGFVNDVTLLQQSTGLTGRNLVLEAVNGSQEAISLLKQRGIEVPVDAKKYAMICELEQVCTSHNLWKDRQRDATGAEIPLTGKPDFDAALAIKKMRDGVDIEERRDAVRRGADSVLNAVTDRMSAPPQISPAEASPAREPEGNTKQLEDMMSNYQKRASTMLPEERTKMRAQIDSTMLKMGLMKMSPT